MDGPDYNGRDIRVTSLGVTQSWQKCVGYYQGKEEKLSDHSGNASWSCFQNLGNSLQYLESLEKKLKIRIDQQDAWVFHSNVFEKICNIELYQFELGRPRCDTRFARILTEENLLVRNPAFEIRSLHLQRTSARKYTNNDQVPGALKYTPLTFLTRYPS